MKKLLRKNRKQRIRNLYTVIGIAVLSFMGVGYAILQANVRVNGNATIDSNFDVIISSIQLKSSKSANHISTNITNAGHTGTINLDIASGSGGYATYDVMVTNKSNRYDAEVTALSGLTEANATEPIDIVTETSLNQAVLIKKNSSKTFTITVKNDKSITSNSNVTEKTINFTIEYTQFTAPSLDDKGIADDGLLVYYDGATKLNNTTWKDLSGNGNNGEIHGATFTSNGLSFDGTDDWVGIKEFVLDEFTYEATITVNNITTTQSIISNIEGNGAELCVSWVDALAGRAYSTTLNDDGAKDYVYNVSSVIPEIGKKYHLVYTFDGTTSKLYVNGNIISTVDVTDYKPDSSNHTIMAVGANPTASTVSGGYYNGTIHSVKVYDRAIDASEVTSNYTYDNSQYSVTSNVTKKDNNLMVEYIGKYRGSTHWLDISGNNNHGLRHGVTNAASNKGFVFDGTDDWVGIKEMNYPQFTLEATFTAEELGSSNWGDILSNFEGQGYIMRISDSYFRSYVYDQDLGSAAYLNNPLLQEPGKTYHWAVTFDGTNMKSYVNGIHVDTKAIGTPVVTPTDNTIMAVGTNPGGSSAQDRFFKGTIHSVKIYNKALTAAQVKADSDESNTLYTLSIPDPYSGNRILWYDGTNHGSSSTVWTNLASSSNNGTLKNGPKFQNNGLLFDGTDDYVAIAKLNYTSLTLEATIRSTIASGAGRGQVISNIQSGGYNITADSASACGAVVLSDSTLSKCYTYPAAGIHHVVMTYNGTNYVLYVDGVQRQTATGTAIKTAGNNTILVLGANPNGTSIDGNYFKGYIYSAKLYNTVLSANRVKHNYEADRARYGF